MTGPLNPPMYSSLNQYGQAPALGTGFNSIGTPELPNTLTGLGTGAYGVGQIATPQGNTINPAELMASPNVDPNTLWESFKNLFSGAIGTKEAPGWGGLAIGGASALSNAFLGMKQYGIAKQTLEEGKRQFNMNWDARRNTMNADLADRQAARLAANPNSGMSVADYMSKYGVK